MILCLKGTLKNTHFMLTFLRKLILVDFAPNLAQIHSNRSVTLLLSHLSVFLSFLFPSIARIVCCAFTRNINLTCVQKPQIFQLCASHFSC